MKFGVKFSSRRAEFEMGLPDLECQRDHVENGYRSTGATRRVYSSLYNTGALRGKIASHLYRTFSPRVALAKTTHALSVGRAST